MYFIKLSKTLENSSFSKGILLLSSSAYIWKGVPEVVAVLALYTAPSIVYNCWSATTFCQYVFEFIIKLSILLSVSPSKGDLLLSLFKYNWKGVPALAEVLALYTVPSTV